MGVMSRFRFFMLFFVLFSFSFLLMSCSSGSKSSSSSVTYGATAEDRTNLSVLDGETAESMSIVDLMPRNELFIQSPHNIRANRLSSSMVFPNFPASVTINGLSYPLSDGAFLYEGNSYYCIPAFIGFTDEFDPNFIFAISTLSSSHIKSIQYVNYDDSELFWLFDTRVVRSRLNIDFVGTIKLKGTLGVVYAVFDINHSFSVSIESTDEELSLIELPFVLTINGAQYAGAFSGDSNSAVLYTADRRRVVGEFVVDDFGLYQVSFYDSNGVLLPLN